MINIYGAKLFRQALSHAIRAIGIDPAGVGDKPDDAFFSNAVRGPSISPNIRIVKRVFIDGFCVGCIRSSNSIIQFLITIVLVVIVGIVLSNGIRRYEEKLAVSIF